MARRRRKRRGLKLTLIAVILGSVAVGAYLLVFPDSRRWAMRWVDSTAEQRAAQSEASARAPTVLAAVGDRLFGSDDHEQAVAISPADVSQARDLAESGRRGLAQDDLLTARAQLSAAMRMGVPEPERTDVAAMLAGIADRALFTGDIVQNDPLVSSHVVEKGETLQRIAQRYMVSPALLAEINGLANPHLIRAGQSLKVVAGPFHAVVSKSGYEMLVYLDTVVVRRFEVGLGVGDGTPAGEWAVASKLENPTYYPPRGGPVVAADDPENPLGERWIGLEGIDGEAVGKERYGIHGTIEPESIGQSKSMGCIRMHNEDVAFLFMLLIEQLSHVTVYP